MHSSKGHLNTYVATPGIAGFCLFLHFIGGLKLAKGITFGCQNQSGGLILEGGLKFLLQAYTNTHTHIRAGRYTGKEDILVIPVSYLTIVYRQTDIP